MKCTTAAALVCLATTAAAAPTPKPFIPPSDLFKGFNEFNGESVYNGLFGKDEPGKDKFKKSDHKKTTVKPYKYEEVLKWDGAGSEPYDWGFNWSRRPLRNGSSGESTEDRKKKDEERKKKEEEDRKKKDEERKKKEEERKKKEEEERKKKEDEDKNKKNNDQGDWKIKNFNRKCTSGGNGNDESKDKDCTIKFEIEQPGKSSSKCEYKIDTLRASISNHKCNDNGNEYNIGAQWSDFFGADKGFTTLSVVDQKNNRIVWPAYSDTELKNGQNFSPDKTYKSQEVPK
ncbi:hypothetical protein MCOR25_003185 [Pyricularia grisea]|uniref:Uncharacterized protein n=1 Tax=Pyricularia grisea TaxID=148305 RepID=A0A6P8B5G9_PYRGI|nr:hypothetical protein PgNI_06399 [Pyricularia grisea]KAI6374396.1 hypothetical protein MCOR25_003185 [Pyricularia grisea]TLD10537.1 hypothetical protein PgNI_06399 [Pyricularia grisea]